MTYMDVLIRMDSRGSVCFMSTDQTGFTEFDVRSDPLTLLTVGSLNRPQKCSHDDYDEISCSSVATLPS